MRYKGLLGITSTNRLSVVKNIKLRPFSTEGFFYLMSIYNYEKDIKTNGVGIGEIG